MAGGTALALQAGHRKSVDLDFFFQESEFSSQDVLERFRGTDWETTFERKGTLYGRLHQAKVSFIAYPFFVPAFEPLHYGTIRVLDVRDIAVMKITAISQRGRKRDFFDLYWCAQNVEPLLDTVKKLKKQYPSIAHNYHHILKALVYFWDAENDPEPEITFRASWKGVKKFFMSEVPKIANELIRHL